MKRTPNKDYINSAAQIPLLDMPDEGKKKFRKLIYTPKKRYPPLVFLIIAVLCALTAAAFIFSETPFKGHEFSYVAALFLIVMVALLLSLSALITMKDRKTVLNIYEFPEKRIGLMKITEATDEVLYYGKERGVHTRGDTVWIGHKAIMLADGMTNQEYDAATGAADAVDLYFYQSDDGLEIHLIYAEPTKELAT